MSSTYPTSSNERPAGPGDRPWQQFELASGVVAMFTSRAGGVSAAPYETLNLSGAVGDVPEAVAGNRSILRAACGGTHPVAWMRQVHGSAVRRVAAEPAGPVPEEVDAQFTEDPGLPLGVLVADCAPVLIADGQARIVGAAHAGREGLAAGVIPELLSAMIAAGAAPSRMHAAIGPMICGACYEVPAQLRDRISAAVPAAGCVTRQGTPGIDVRAGIEAQFATVGVSSVTRDRRCTAETGDLYSYRRDGTTGRFAGVIWLAS